jgi:hypothetical protein
MKSVIFSLLKPATSGMVLLMLSAQLLALTTPQNILDLRAQPIYELPLIIKLAKTTSQSNEWALPDLKGEFDGHIPVDAAYPLPDVPSRLHDVATVRNGRFLRPHIPVARTTNDGRIGITSDAQTGGLKFLLYVPEKLEARGIHYLQMNDGSSELMSDKVWHLTSRRGLLPQGERFDAIDPSMFAICDTSFAQIDNELYAESNDAMHRNPYPVGPNREAYIVTLFTSSVSRGSDIDTDPESNAETLLLTVNVRITVENPKTPEAEIVAIEGVGEPTVVVAPSRPNSIFEPSITGDGRLLVTRISGTAGSGGGTDSLEPRPWVDANGLTRHTFHDIVYAYNPPGSGYSPCDVRGWTNLKPITYAHHDPEVRERYGFAKFPMRDTEGVEFLPAQESGMMYPWIDRTGANMMFTSTRRMKVSNEFTYATNENVELLETLSSDESNDASGREDFLYEASVSIPTEAARPHLLMPSAHQIPLPDPSLHCTDCEETTAREHVSPTRQIGIVGLWTQGKMVQLDGIVNATEIGYRVLDEGHKLIRLYHGQGGVVRVGNGRTNVVPQPEWGDLDSYWPGNDSIMDSLENKFNWTPSMRPVAPYDVVWAVGTGRGTSEVVFDDYMDNDALILSEMVASVSTVAGPIVWNQPNNGDRYNVPLRIQNSSPRIGLLNASYGEVFGDTKKGTRIEPVALGGIYGKGLWVNEGVGVRYHFPAVGLAEAQEKTAAYYGLAIDPRIDVGITGEYRLITSPTGLITLKTENGQSKLVIGGHPAPLKPVTDSGYQVDLPNLSANKWTHLGIEVDGTELAVYIDGFKYFKQALADNDTNLLQVSTGDIILGSTDGVSGGLRGWVDDFKVFSRSVLNPEEACNRGWGTLLRVPGSALASGYLASSHGEISLALGDSNDTRYQCLTDYDSEGFAFLAGVPAENRVGQALRQVKSLQFDAARPDETDNAFCTVCHVDFEHPSETMSLSALVFDDIPMQFDRRRQPLQPFPAVIGHVPASWLQSSQPGFPGVNQSYSEFGEWLLIDSGTLNNGLKKSQVPEDATDSVEPLLSRSSGGRTSGGGSISLWIFPMVILVLWLRRRRFELPLYR